MALESLVIYNAAPIEDMRANTIQTTLNAIEIAKLTNCHYHMLSVSGQGDQIFKRISEAGFDGELHFHRNKLSLLFGVLFDLLRSNGKLYCRSMTMALFVNYFLSRTAIVELHQDRLTNRKRIDSVLRLVLRKIKPRKLKVVVISDALKQIFESQGLALNLVVIHDGFDAPQASQLTTSKPRITYTGMVSFERGFGEICDLAKVFSECRFVVLGADPKLVHHFRQHANSISSNIRVYSKQSRYRVHQFQVSSTVLLAFWGDDVPTMEYCSPLKIFEYMATGNRILMHDYKVLDEVVPETPLIKRFKSGDIKGAEIELGALLELQETSADSADLVEYGDRFSYKSRAEKLVAL